jgi:hypothetical protein
MIGIVEKLSEKKLRNIYKKKKNKKKNKKKGLLA